MRIHASCSNTAAPSGRVGHSFPDRSRPRRVARGLPSSPFTRRKGWRHKTGLGICGDRFDCAAGRWRRAAESRSDRFIHLRPTVTIRADQPAPNRTRHRRRWGRLLQQRDSVRWRSRTKDRGSAFLESPGGDYQISAILADGADVSAIVHQPVNVINLESHLTIYMMIVINSGYMTVII